ncbi:MAG: hypothetical protein AB1390_07345 [Nitrospirota bacterium]
MTKNLLFFFIFLLLLCGKSYGFEIKGLQPVDPYGIFSTFSADSLSRGKAAFAGGAEISIDPDLYRFIFKAAYGITDNVELNMTVPYVSGSDSVDGFEDVALGIKHRFFEEGKYGPSAAYILSGSLPAGRDELSTDGRASLGFIVSKRVGPVNGHLNLFYAIPGSGDLEKELSLLAGLDFSAAHNFKLLAELIVKKSHDSEKIDMVEGRIGYRIMTTDFIYTTFGAGFDFKNRNPETRIMFTVTFLSPSEKKKIERIFEEE